MKWLITTRWHVERCQRRGKCEINKPGQQFAQALCVYCMMSPTMCRLSGPASGIDALKPDSPLRYRIPWQAVMYVCELHRGFDPGDVGALLQIQRNSAAMTITAKNSKSLSSTADHAMCLEAGGVNHSTSTSPSPAIREPSRRLGKLAR